MSDTAEDSLSLDESFLYMANALGRLLGTVLSDWMFERFGLASCLGTSALLVEVAAIVA